MQLLHTYELTELGTFLRVSDRAWGTFEGEYRTQESLSRELDAPVKALGAFLRMSDLLKSDCRV